MYREREGPDEAVMKVVVVVEMRAVVAVSVATPVTAAEMVEVTAEAVAAGEAASNLFSYKLSIKYRDTRFSIVEWNFFLFLFEWNAKTNQC